MKFCIDTIFWTLLSLVKERYIKIEKTKTPIRWFGKTVLTKTKYELILIRQPTQESLTGWLEEILFSLLTEEKYQVLDRVVEALLQQVFAGDKGMYNPGKIFILRMIEHQKMDLFTASQTDGFFSVYVIVSAKNGSFCKSDKPLIMLNELHTAPDILNDIWDVIRCKLGKFQDLG